MRELRKDIFAGQTCRPSKKLFERWEAKRISGKRLAYEKLAR